MSKDASAQSKTGLIKSSWHWSTLIPIIVSLLALWIAYDQGAQTRLHNRLSVRPDLYVNFHSNNESAAFSVGNTGLGPARIRWFKVLIDQAPVTEWDEVMRRLQLDGKYSFSVLYPGTVVSPGYRNEIFLVKDAMSGSKLIKARDRIAVEICYCSFYDECWRARDRIIEGPEAANCATEKVIPNFHASKLQPPQELFKKNQLLPTP